MGEPGTGAAGTVSAMMRELLREHDEAPQPPASEADVAGLQARVAGPGGLGGTLPPEYLDLLRDQNGGETNGLRFFGTHSAPLAGTPGVVLPGLVEINQDLREGGGLDEHVVLAQGSTALFALHVPTRLFHELSVVPRDVVGVHTSFEGLMAAAIHSHR